MFTYLTCLEAVILYQSLPKALIRFRSGIAGVAQLVELHVANVVVAGSNPVSCSNIWRHSQVVRRRSAKSLFIGSNPIAASI